MSSKKEILENYSNPLKTLSEETALNYISVEELSLHF